MRHENGHFIIVVGGHRPYLKAPRGTIKKHKQKKISHSSPRKTQQKKGGASQDPQSSQCSHSPKITRSIHAETVVGERVKGDVAVTVGGGGQEHDGRRRRRRPQQ